MIEDLRYIPATKEHADNIMELLQDQFRKHEPINASINATEEDLIDVFRDDVKCAYTNEKYGTLAYDGNRLVGMCLCSMIPNNSKDPVELDIRNLPIEIDIRKRDFAKDILNGPYKQHKANQIVVFVRTLEEIMQQMLSNYKILKMNVLSVHEDCTGKGLGKELNRRAIQIAKEEECDYIATVATAMASQAIFTKQMLDKFHLVPVTKDRADEILQFLSDQFGTNEPITKSIQATKEDVIDFYRDLTKNACEFDKYSTLVYDENRLVGICLCSLCLPGTVKASSLTEIKVNDHDYTEEIRNGLYRQHKANQITVLVHLLEEELKRLLSKSKFMELDILCIHKDYTGRGLGKELTQRATEMAKAEGCEYVAAVATAGASQAIFTKYGWETLSEIPYTDYCENGNPVFQNLHDGHRSAKAMALKLNS